MWKVAPRSRYLEFAWSVAHSAGAAVRARAGVSSAPLASVATDLSRIAPGDGQTSPGRGTGGRTPMQDDRSARWPVNVARSDTPEHEHQRRLVLELAVDPPREGDHPDDLAR